MTNRRQFMHQAAMAATGLALAPAVLAEPMKKKLFFDISLAEWSLHKALRAGKITNLDFPGIAKKEFDISIVEYVSVFFKDKAKDTTYLNDLLTRCKDNGISNHLIMVDNEGGLGDLETVKRQQAVDNHKKWVECAKYLGCKTIRVNAHGVGSSADIMKSAVEGLSSLGEFARPLGINVIVENHGGYSSNGEWLAGVMKQVQLKNVGTLPDFGNFCLRRADNGTEWGGECVEDYDRYKGTKEMMPYAKGVSAKTFDFNADGTDTLIDYEKMMKIIKDSGFRGIVGIEYEGEHTDEYEGIRKTKALLERTGAMV